MTNDTRTSDDIERDIVDERAQMSNTINDLQKKFSVDAIVGDLGTMFRNQGGELGRAVSQTLGRNPAAVVMVGVGLAWLFMGQNRTQSANPTADPWAETDNKRKGATYQSWSSRAARADRPDGSGHDERDQYWYGNDQMAQSRRAAGQGLGGGSKDRLQTASNGVMGAVSEAAGAVGDAVSGAAANLGHSASGLSERLSHGLEDFSEEARARILAARRAAHDARVASAATVKKGARVASNFFEDQPLVVGALAVALGAAIGGVLPHSKLEDDTLGDSSDRLFADAQALFREERDKAMAAVRMAATDVKGEIKDIGSDLSDLLPDGKTVGTVIVDRAADAASRVFEHATGDVEHQGSGKSEI